MANQFASVTSAAGILKNYYEGPIVTQFNDKIPLYKEMEKGKDKWNGLKVVRPLKVRRNPGIGATSDGGTLPAIGQQTTVQAEIAAKYNYLRFGLTAPLLKASQGDKGAFVSAMEYEMKEGLNDLKKDFNRQLFWDGTSDLATVAANVVASNVITATGRESTEAGNKFLDIGMVIDIYNGTTPVATGVTINNLTGTTTVTLTLSAAVTTTAGDIIVRSGSFGNEVQGLLTTLDGGTSTIYAVDRSSYPSYQGNVLNCLGNQLSLDLLQQSYNEGKRRGGAMYDLIVSDFDSERYYNKLLVVDKRYVGRVAGDGTFSSKDGSYLEYGEVKWIPDPDAPTRIFFLDVGQWKKYVLGAELEWADETGSPMIAQVSADAFECRLRLFANIFCEKPSAQAVLRNYISP